MYLNFVLDHCRPEVLLVKTLQEKETVGISAATCQPQILMMLPVCAGVHDLQTSLHDEAGILWLLPVLQVFEVAYERSIFKPAILSQPCKTSLMNHIVLVMNNSGEVGNVASIHTVQVLGTAEALHKLQFQQKAFFFGAASLCW